MADAAGGPVDGSVGLGREGSVDVRSVGDAAGGADGFEGSPVAAGSVGDAAGGADGSEGSPAAVKVGSWPVGGKEGSDGS